LIAHRVEHPTSKRPRRAGMAQRTDLISVEEIFEYNHIDLEYVMAGFVLVTYYNY
jgi:hypothetical protein